MSLLYCALSQCSPSAALQKYLQPGAPTSAAYQRDFLAVQCRVVQCHPTKQHFNRDNVNWMASPMVAALLMLLLPPIGSGCAGGGCCAAAVAGMCRRLGSDYAPLTAAFVVCHTEIC